MFIRNKDVPLRRLSQCLSQCLRVSALLVVAAGAGTALAAGPATKAPAVPGQTQESVLLERLKKLYPTTEFSSVARTPLPGVFAVAMGTQMAYVGPDARHFLFGQLVEAAGQSDPAASKAATARIDVAGLPLRDAIVRVNGSGARKLVVFLDPKCAACGPLETDLLQLEDTTLYTFLVPLLGRESRQLAQKQWIVFMPERALETQIIDQHLQLAQRLGINAAPTLIRADGELLAGALPLPMLDAWLEAGVKVAEVSPR